MTVDNEGQLRFHLPSRITNPGPSPSETSFKLHELSHGALKLFLGKAEQRPVTADTRHQSDEKVLRSSDNCSAGTE